MNWLKNLKTSAKLLVGFGTMIVLLGTIVVIAYQTITAIRDSQQRLFEQDFADVVDMVELRADLNRQRARILEMLLTTNRPELDALAVDIHSRAKEVDQALQGFFGRHANDAQTLLKVEELKGLLTAYRQTREQQMTLIFAGKAEEARRTAESLQTDRFEKMRVVAVELGYHALARAKANLIKSNEDAARAVRMFTILAALAFLVGITMTAVLNRLIAGPLKELTAAADRIAAGDLSGNVSPEARNDEVGMLARTFERMTQSLREQMRQLAEGANVLGASASEIVASSTQLAASAAESAAAVSETATTVQEVRQTVDLASQKAMV
jgi:methyl-accepting chemotaxis protein